MDAHLDALLAAFVRLREPEPANVASSLRGLPEPGVLPSPWDTWTLIGLTRHRERQLWVAKIIRTRLRGDPDDLADTGALGHPEGVPQSGPVPGMPEWEYYFHGRGCCISHKVDGDAIDVDFWDDSADYFDTYFFRNYLKSLRRPEPPEQRLRDLHPSSRAVTIAVNDLLAAGALTPLPGSDTHPYRLTDKVVAVASDIDSFCTAWSYPDRRVWLAALIGDWLAADAAAAGRPELTAITGPRAGRCRELRRQRLRQELDAGNRGADALQQALADLRPPDLDHRLEDALRGKNKGKLKGKIKQLRQELDAVNRGADALQALADLPAPDLDQCLEATLSGPPSGLISAALDVIGQQDDPRWCTRVHELFSRVDPAGQSPQPRIWITALKFLLRHGHRTPEVIASLAKAGSTEVGEAVLLSLEHAPELALPLVRKGLLADVPMDRTQVAAILALINAPWSRRELLGALEASDEQEKTADARAALVETGDEEAQRAVLAWEERNPHENETGRYLEIGERRLGPCNTFGEHWLKSRDSRIRDEMDKLHDRVMKVKNIVPPEPPVP
jgi:hypothetical protein